MNRAEQIDSARSANKSEPWATSLSRAIHLFDKLRGGWHNPDRGRPDSVPVQRVRVNLRSSVDHSLHFGRSIASMAYEYMIDAIDATGNHHQSYEGVRMIRIITRSMLLLSLPWLLTGCPTGAGTTTNVRESSGQNMASVQAEHYNGPKARIAVARFDNKTADSQNWYSPSIGDGMADMLTTALVNSGRYIVLERASLDTVLSEQDLGASGRIRQDTAAAIGEIEGAELLVVAAVTEFGDSGGMQGSVGGGKWGRALGAIAGGTRSAHMAIDLRVVDASTSRILAATSVEGEAKDFNIGGALSGYTGSVGLGGSLSSWKNTPREKALRDVIEAAVDYVISVTPPTMMRYDAMGNVVGSGYSAGSSSAATSRVVITASSLNVRSGPASSHGVLFALTSGTVVDALDRSSGWVNIRDSQGREGWVSADFVLEVQ